MVFQVNGSRGPRWVRAGWEGPALVGLVGSDPNQWRRDAGGEAQPHLLVVEAHDDDLLTPSGLVFSSPSTWPSFIFLLFVVLQRPHDSSQGAAGLLLLLQGGEHPVQEGEEAIDPLGAAFLHLLHPVQNLRGPLPVGPRAQAYADRGGVGGWHGWGWEHSGWRRRERNSVENQSGHNPEEIRSKTGVAEREMKETKQKQQPER